MHLQLSARWGHPIWGSPNSPRSLAAPLPCFLPACLITMVVHVFVHADTKFVQVWWVTGLAVVSTWTTVLLNYWICWPGWLYYSSVFVTVPLLRDKVFILKAVTTSQTYNLTSVEPLPVWKTYAVLAWIMLTHDLVFLILSKIHIISEIPTPWNCYTGYRLVYADGRAATSFCSG